ncbi:hypothetical protein R3I93_004745 [Phoxinus phoxinus]|uniref:Uncharacterized protein n=1 Tax=Phoxinus phoxinus TaxID=58324 RepID=A0AAN9DE51_9TELE
MTAPPEMMSVNTLTSLLRINKNEKKNLKEELKKVGVVPGPVTQVTSLCTRLTEGEAKDLCQSVGVLAAKGIKFEAVTMPMTTDLIVAIGKATELKYQLQHLAEEVQRNGQDFHNLSHGLGPGMVNVVVEILSKCIDDNIKKMQS